MTAAITLFALALLAPGDAGTLLNILHQIAAVAGATIAVAVGLVTALPEQRRVRAAILLAMLTAVVGQLVYFAQAGQSSSPSILADLIFAIAVTYGLGTLTWILFTELERPVLVGIAIDSAILFVAGSTAVLTVWQSQLGPAANEADLLGVLAAVAVLACMSGWVVAILAARVRIAPSGPWAVLGGLVLVGIAWITRLAVFANGETGAIVPTDMLTSIGVVTFAFGGITWGVRTTASPRYAGVARWLSDHLAIAAIMVSVGFMLLPHAPAVPETAAVGAGAVMLLTIGRQMYLVRRDRGFAAEHARLAQAIAQSPESIVITNTHGTIEYVNPAFERVTGYSRAEAIGRNPRLVKSGVQPDSFYAAMWSALTSGHPWSADFVNRRKDGTVYSEEAIISPVCDDDGRITGYVAVKRDVTRERAAEALATRLTRERTLVADTISWLRPDEAPEVAADAICSQIVSLTGLFMAGIFLFTLDGRASPLAIVTADGQTLPLRRLPFQHSQHLRERAAAGPWIEAWTNRPWHPYNRATMAAGIADVATVPLRHGRTLIGILVASQLASASVTVAEELPALVEYAGLIGMALGPGVAERLEVARGQARLSAVIRDGAFHPVFQPIIDTRRDRVVAYEALTRFTDGTPPDVQFEEAANIGLGIELDLAAMRAAIDAARDLPAGMPLHLNASPATMVAGAALHALVETAGRPIVLEVTEHAAIEDYERLRGALAALGSGVRLAVDDAGSGFASLRHVVELQPAVIKLDRSVIEGLDHDPAREALVAGMVHVARGLGCELVAEGVETEAELRALTRHHLHLIQGYLLGPPVPIEELGVGVMSP